MNLHVILPSTPVPLNTASFLHHLIAPKMEMNETSQFKAALVHDIRNPLTTINLATEMLRSLVTDDYQKEYLDIILRGSGKINNIVSDLLHSSVQADNGPQQYSVHQLLDEILVGATDQILLKKIIVTKEYQPNDCKIELNRAKVKIALTNILVNAVEAVKTGTGQIKLLTSFIAGRYVIQVEDNGCGMSKAIMKNLFRPYFTNKVGGLGIGLATSYDILRTEKIEVKVESVIGLGTRFFLLFP